MAVKVQCGYDDLDYIIGNVITMNRSFTILLNASEPLCALALIRIQLDNLRHIYAECKYPGCILYRIFENENELKHIKVNGKTINPSHLVQELDERFGKVKNIWNNYCQYVHPAKSVFMLQLDSYFSDGQQKLSKKTIKQLSIDMVYINQIITTVLLDRLSELEAIIKEKGKFRDYNNTNN